MGTIWNSAKDVFIQDSASPLFQYFMMTEDKNDITLTSDVGVDDVIINVSSGHGFAANDMLVMWCENAFEQALVLSVSTDAITIDIPVANIFLADCTIVIRGSKELNIDASGGDIDFVFKMYNSNIPIDISKAIFTMQHGANVPDDGKFGGLGALTNGLLLRQVDGTRTNFGVYKSNQDFKDRGAKVTYSDKAPAGTNATDIVFDIKEIFGQVIRINPRKNDYVLAKQRDDLDATSGMAKFTISLIGSYTEGE